MSLLARLRRDRPPAEVAGALEPGDLLLTWAATDDGFLVASRCGLRLPDARLLPWHRIDRAAWRDGVMQLTEAVEVEPGVMDPQPPMTICVAEPRNLPPVVQTRVTQSVAHTSRHALPGGGAVRVVARRVVGQDGLEWSLRYESGADRFDDAVREPAEHLLSEIRAATSPGQ